MGLPKKDDLMGQKTPLLSIVCNTWMKYSLTFFEFVAQLTYLKKRCY